MSKPRRQRYRIQRAALVPSVNAQGPSTPAPARIGLTAAAGHASCRQYSATLGVTAFELDLFGRVRSLRRSALEQFLSLDETRQSAHLSLVSEVANAWLTLLADRELLNLTQETLQSQQSSFDLTKLRFNSGCGERARRASGRDRLANRRDEHRDLLTACRAGSERAHAARGRAAGARVRLG